MGCTEPCTAHTPGREYITDLLQDGVLDEAKLTPIAPTWRRHCEDRIRRLMAKAHSLQDGPQGIGPTLLGLEHWKLRKVAEHQRRDSRKQFGWR